MFDYRTKADANLSLQEREGLYKDRIISFHYVKHNVR
jgi:hypothetical protein